LFRVAGVRSEEDGHSGNELADLGPEAKGWLSAKYCIYPQSVVLALPERTIVEKIQIMGHPWATTTAMEIWLGDVPKGEEVDLKKAMFFKAGDLSMSSNKENDYSARQLQSVEITQAAKPCRVSFVKLVLHKNHQNRKNQYNQVGLFGVNLIGQPTSCATPEGDWLEDVLSPYDDLSFLMYTDSEVAQLIAKLEKKKLEAVATERFEYAKKIKSAIGELVEAGQMLASLQMEKRLLAERQMYDEAKEKKEQMEDFRVEVYKNLEITDLLELQGVKGV